ncbi:MAG: hypothetical protein LBD58_13525 [Treponema sp.]|jgi:hypothetical protein|nr:hypothetical protein [Treponema sp.]
MPAIALLAIVIGEHDFEANEITANPRLLAAKNNQPALYQGIREYSECLDERSCPDRAE